MCIFLIIFRSFLPRMRNVLDKVVEKMMIHFVFNNPPPEVVPFEIRWKNLVETDRPEMTI